VRLTNQIAAANPASKTAAARIFQRSIFIATGNGGKDSRSRETRSGQGSNLL
jgi:hypothetical protein